MSLTKKLSMSIIMAAAVAAMAAFAGVAHGHDPEQCAEIPAHNPYQYAACHHQSDQGTPHAQTEDGFEAREGHADLTWVRQYTSDPITTCIGRSDLTRREE